jgi:phage-related baseplate assembly protein
MISLTDLTTPLTRDEAKQSIYDVLAATGVDTTTWKPGAVVRTMIAAVAILVAALSQLTAAVAKSGFLDLSSGDWLTLVAKYVYGVDRIEATFAEGEVTLTNAGGGVFVMAVDDLVVANPTSGKTYRNSSAFTLNAVATLTVPIVATEAGSSSTSTGNTITSVETTMLGVTCTNADSVVGSDAESDPNLRARCREKLGSLSPNGPWDAYTYAAKNALRSDDTAIGVTRVRVIKDGYGNVDVYCATSSGGITGTATDETTDLGAIDLAIQQNAAPLAVTATARTAVAVVQGVTYEVWMYNTSGLSSAEIQNLISAALAAYAASVPIGGNVIDNDPGKIFVHALQAVIRGVRPNEIFKVAVTSPAADIELAGSEVWTLGTVTCTRINQLAAPEGSP